MTRVDVLCGCLLTLSSIITSTVAGAGEFEDAAKAYIDGGYATALDGWTKLAERGDVDAEYNVACMLVRGDGTQPNKERAIVWFKKASEQGQSDARIWLFFETPDHLNDEKRKALFAEKIKPTEKFVISYSLVLANGSVIRWQCTDPKRDAAEKQFALGLMFDKGGMGQPQDDTQAVEWYRKAAALDHPIAESNLAYMYAVGRGVTQDFSKARVLFSRAAEHGHPFAVGHLGVMFERGVGGAPFDLTMAYVLYRHAAEGGSEIARDPLAALVPHMNKDQLSEGERLASQWEKGTLMPAAIRAKLPPH
jgi:uncharacterized protein